MAFKALLLDPNGNFSEIVVENTLEALQSAVGGYIEPLHFTPDVHAFVNEDGKERNLAFNKNATMLARVYGIGLRPDDYVCGNIIFYSDKDAKGEEDGECHDCPADFIQQVKNLIART